MEPRASFRARVATGRNTSLTRGGASCVSCQKCARSANRSASRNKHAAKWSKYGCTRMCTPASFFFLSIRFRVGDEINPSARRLRARLRLRRLRPPPPSSSSRVPQTLPLRLARALRPPPAARLWRAACPPSSERSARCGTGPARPTLKPWGCPFGAAFAACPAGRRTSACRAPEKDATARRVLACTFSTPATRRGARLYNARNALRTAPRREKGA
mmetsp:Transcript_14195/g.59802  ORF Transcript_14195/g.59802 Transcript_14195/m.59802 type:complete len:216 (-) Transcript_14195:687-1334(-)